LIDFNYLQIKARSIIGDCINLSTELTV